MGPGSAPHSGITLEAIFEEKAFDEKTLKQPQWLNDGRRLSYLDSYPDTDRQTVWIYDAETRERWPVLDPGTCRAGDSSDLQPIHSCQWSHDEQRLLFTAHAPARFKPTGNLFVYELEARRFRALTQTDQPQLNPKFSPDGRWVGVVRADDLWLLSIEDGREHRLTDDAAPAVYNGRFGWVYEEELGLSDGWSWSPDGSRIACYQIDESAVPEYLIPRYDEPHADSERTRYPKAGDANPTARIRILDVASGQSRWIDQGAAEEHYLARMQWTPSGHGLLVQRIPRLQNRIELLFANADDGTVRTVLSEEDAAWVSTRGDLRFVGESDLFIWPSDRDGNTHLYLYDLGGQCHQQLTSGPWDVEELVGIDPDAGHAYFTAAAPDPTERRLFSVSLRGGAPTCLVSEPGCHRALFSRDGRRFLHTVSTLDAPPIQAVRAVDSKTTDTLVVESVSRLGACSLERWSICRFATSDGVLLNARMLKPPGFNAAAKYPVLMCVYGGPGSQVVTNSWGGARSLWLHTLADAGYVVFMVDGRGTGGRGRDFMKVTYLNLGHWETHDQIEGARHLASLPFIDAARIGIWGWSYGGYMALNCMLHGGHVFRAGVAVAPVTDWALYDTIYTERYMRRPTENQEAYKESAPTTHAAQLKGGLLLVHGLMDDNVHFQHSARFAAELQKAKIPFQTMFYPGKRHGIEDVHAHLYGLMREFVLANL